VLFCRAGVTDFNDCGFETFEFADVDGSGNIDLTIVAHTKLLLDDGTRLDCRVDACSLVVTEDESFRDLAEMPLSFDPAGGLVDISVSVTPSTGLHDGDVVQVDGEGRAGAGAFGLQCLANAQDFGACDFDTAHGFGGGGIIALFGRRDPTLAPFSGQYEVTRELKLENGRTVDCSLVPCALVVTEGSGLDVAGRAALDFARVPATVDPVTATPTFTG
jgi:hypothetical protein